MHLHDPHTTIVAVASAPGPAVRGIVRVSGPQLFDCLAAVFRTEAGEPLTPPRRPSLIAGTWLLPETELRMPGELFIWPTERSYTRQPLAEWHTIGSPPLLEAAVEACCRHGARLAEPGEFTMRAFLAGRIDLTQAEAVLGVIDAHDQQEASLALSQLAGGLKTHLGRLREELLELLAHLEAGLDFVDEDIEFISTKELVGQLTAAAELVGQLAEQAASRTEIREQVRIVLAGEPNVGKSSLFNKLTAGATQQTVRALVSNIPGTTRDYLTAPLALGDLTATLIDTAGRESVSSDGQTPASVAQQQTLAQLASAQITVLCLDSTRRPSAWEAEQLALTPDRPRVVVLTKCESSTSEVDQFLDHGLQQKVIRTSTVTGAGCEELKQRLAELAVQVQPAEGGGVVAATALRCRESLRQAAESLARAREMAAQSAGEEFVAAEIRLALAELGQVVGAVYTDDILDRIFSRFCIGK